MEINEYPNRAVILSVPANIRKNTEWSNSVNSEELESSVRKVFYLPD